MINTTSIGPTQMLISRIVTRFGSALAAIGLAALSSVSTAFATVQR